MLALLYVGNDRNVQQPGDAVAIVINELLPSHPTALSLRVDTGLRISCTVNPMQAAAVSSFSSARASSFFERIDPVGT